MIADLGNACFIAKPFDADVLIRTLSQSPVLCGGSSESSAEGGRFEAAAADILHRMGVPAHLKGYRYLHRAIQLSAENRELSECVTKLLYPAVAEYFGTTPSCVERAIRSAIGITWSRGSLDVLYDLFGFTVNTRKGKPTNSEFISLVSDKLRVRHNAAAGKKGKSR